MIQVLGESKEGISAAYFTGDEIGRLNRVIDLADVLVICRARYSNALRQLITRARSKGVRVLFDIDDLVFDPEYVPLLVQTADQQSYPTAWQYWHEYVTQIEATLHLCEAIITTNSYLAALIATFCRQVAHVIPNFLNREQIAISQRIFNRKQNHGFAKNEQIYLGYFSGTPVHNRDFKLISDALISLFKRDRRVTAMIVGFLNLDGEILNYSSRIKFYPLQDFINLQRFIGMVDVNLAPLRSNPISNCKSELKYFEAGIVGTVTVASPTFAYANTIRDGENGCLADISEWEAKLESIINPRGNYQRMAEEAYTDSERKYAWYNQLALIEKTLFP